MPCYDAEYFRYGVISGGLDIEEQLNKVGSFTVTFNCKPYKYSYKGNNLYNKLDRDNLSERELRAIADALNCDYDGIFTFRDTGKQI